MNCIKCGREIGEDQVFCPICLDEMEDYPVQPGTAVHIPARSPEEEVKKAPAKKKRMLTPAEQVLKLRKKVKRLRVTLAILLLLCGLLCFAVAQAVVELDFQRVLGQNYNTVQTHEETPATQSAP